MLKFGDNEIEEQKFHSSKSAFIIDYVHIKNISEPDAFVYNINKNQSLNFLSGLKMIE